MLENNNHYQGLSEEEKARQQHEWTQQEYARTLRYCSGLGVEVSRVNQQDSKCLPPIICVWKVETKDKKTPNLWVISGDVPTDHIAVEHAANPREVLKYFSLSWQMKSNRLETGLESGKLELQDAESQKKFAATLQQKAEGLYSLFEDDRLWAKANL